MPDFLTRDISLLGALLVVAVVAIAVATDLRRRKIYNALTFPAMALGFVVNGITDGSSGLLFAGTGLLLGAVLFLAPVALLGRGAGDLKLLAAVGALGGPTFVIWCGMLTGIAGALFGVVVLLRMRRLGEVVAGMTLDAASGQFPAATSRIRLPYAVPIAAGAVLTLAIF
jgi:prepilin peptidase CpaA